jgi:hypothetical protein
VHKSIDLLKLTIVYAAKAMAVLKYEQVLQDNRITWSETHQNYYCVSILLFCRDVNKTVTGIIL